MKVKNQPTLVLTNVGWVSQNGWEWKGFKLIFIVNIDDSHLNSHFRWESPSQELPKISLDPNLDFGGIIKLTLWVWSST
jgi:hypothetical protein